MPDALTMLNDDHQRVEKLFKECEDTLTERSRPADGASTRRSRRGPSYRHGRTPARRTSRLPTRRSAS